jgi:hypothetical protein
MSSRLPPYRLCKSPRLQSLEFHSEQVQHLDVEPQTVGLGEEGLQVPANLALVTRRDGRLKSRTTVREGDETWSCVWGEGSG